MPSTRPATVRVSDLADVITAQELADFARVDVRTIRAALAAGQVPGARRIGQTWRIVTSEYLAAEQVAS